MKDWQPGDPLRPQDDDFAGEEPDDWEPEDDDEEPHIVRRCGDVVVLSDGKVRMIPLALQRERAKVVSLDLRRWHRDRWAAWLAGEDGPPEIIRPRRPRE